MEATNKVTIVRLGGLEPLIRLMMSANVEVQCNAVGCITNLATHGPTACRGRLMVDENKNKIARSTALGPLTRLARSKDIRVQRNATGALLNMTHSGTPPQPPLSPSSHFCACAYAVGRRKSSIVGTSRGSPRPRRPFTLPRPRYPVLLHDRNLQYRRRPHESRTSRADREGISLGTRSTHGRGRRISRRTSCPRIPKSRL
jgi:Armadillo/beta-catenin-like repeat